MKNARLMGHGWHRTLPRIVHCFALAGLILGLSGCGSRPDPISKDSPPLKAEKPSSEPPRAAASDRQANPDGVVFVVEYHHISAKEARWDRSRDRFKADLERLYKLGFRPITLSEYIDGKFDIPRGASPVVFTFDDANPSQIRLLKDGTLDPECGMGIWQEFARTHPDFPMKASFYVLPTMWGQKSVIEKKVEMLRGWGSELGSHTLTHPQLKKLSDDKVKSELGGAIDMLEKYGQSSPVAIALPFGISPKAPEMLKSFEWKGKKYQMKGALLVGSNPAPAPTAPKFDAFRIPRIQGIEGPLGITYWLDKVEKGDVKPMVK